MSKHDDSCIDDYGHMVEAGYCTFCGKRVYSVAERQVFAIEGVLREESKRLEGLTNVGAVHERYLIRRVRDAMGPSDWHLTALQEARRQGLRDAYKIVERYSDELMPPRGEESPRMEAEPLLAKILWEIEKVEEGL